MGLHHELSPESLPGQLPHLQTAGGPSAPSAATLLLLRAAGKPSQTHSQGVALMLSLGSVLPSLGT